MPIDKLTCQIRECMTVLDVEVIEEPAAATSILDPLRSLILDALIEPGSATTLRCSRRVAPKDQLPPAGARGARAREVVEERPRRGLTERVMVASARSYMLSPDTLGASARDPANRSSVVPLPRRRRGSHGPRGGRPRPSGRRGRQTVGDAGDRHRDPVRVRCRSRRVHGGTHRRSRLSPPATTTRGRKRRSLAPTRRRCPSPTTPHHQTEALTMTDERSIELEIEVTGTPEEVWRAIATGPASRRGTCRTRSKSARAARRWRRSAPAPRCRSPGGLRHGIRRTGSCSTAAKGRRAGLRVARRSS